MRKLDNKFFTLFLFILYISFLNCQNDNKDNKTKPKTKNTNNNAITRKALDDDATGVNSLQSKNDNITQPKTKDTNVIPNNVLYDDTTRVNPLQSKNNNEDNEKDTNQSSIKPEDDKLNISNDKDNSENGQKNSMLNQNNINNQQNKKKNQIIECPTNEKFFIDLQGFLNDEDEKNEKNEKVDKDKENKCLDLNSDSNKVNNLKDGMDQSNDFYKATTNKNYANKEKERLDALQKQEEKANEKLKLLNKNCIQFKQTHIDSLKHKLINFINTEINTVYFEDFTISINKNKILDNLLFNFLKFNPDINQLSDDKTALMKLAIFILRRIFDNQKPVYINNCFKLFKSKNISESYKKNLFHVCQKITNIKDQTFIATFLGLNEIVIENLSNGSDKLNQDTFENLFHCALYSGNQEIILFLVNKYEQFIKNIVLKNSNIPILSIVLLNLIAYNNIESVKYFIKHKSIKYFINANEEGKAPALSIGIKECIDNNNIELLDLLLEKGKNLYNNIIPVPPYFGESRNPTTMEYCLKNDKYDILIHLLLNHEFDFEKFDFGNKIIEYTLEKILKNTDVIKIKFLLDILEILLYKVSPNTIKHYKCLKSSNNDKEKLTIEEFINNDENFNKLSAIISEPFENLKKVLKERTDLAY